MQAQKNENSGGFSLKRKYNLISSFFCISSTFAFPTKKEGNHDLIFLMSNVSVGIKIIKLCWGIFFNVVSECVFVLFCLTNRRCLTKLNEIPQNCGDELAQVYKVLNYKSA